MALTLAKVSANLKNATHILEETRKFAADNADNFIGLQDTYNVAQEGDRAAEGLASIDDLRIALDGMLNAPENIIDPVILQWGEFIDAPESDIPSLLSRMYDFFIANAITIESRDFNFGTPTKDAANIGTGLVERLNVDAQNQSLENQTVDSKVIECIIDQNSGTTRNAEAMRIRGGYGGFDSLDIQGAGDDFLDFIVSSSDTSLISNSGLDNFSGTAAAPTEITSWESIEKASAGEADIAVNGTNYEFVQVVSTITGFLQPSNDNIDTFSLKVKVGDARLRQKLINEGITLEPNRPYYMSINWFRTSWTGTLTIRMGSVSASVAVVAQSGFQTLKIVIGVNSWFENFNQDELSIEVEWEQTGGSDDLLIDNIVFEQWKQFDGGYYEVLAGQTPFQTKHSTLVNGDRFTWNDVLVGSDSIIQRWLWRAYGAYLPHSGTPSITDP